MCHCEYICDMKGAREKKKKKIESPFATVRIKRTTLSLLQSNKEKTSVPISAFIDQAVREKLKK